jgi:drug/metabolite transporter (DMT)-like permease
MWRLITAACLLGLWAHLFGQGLGGGQFAILFLAGIIGFGAGGWCMFQAFPRIGSTLSLLVVECAAALLTLVIGWLVLDAGVSLQQAAFALLIIVGILIALAPFRLPDVPTATLLAGAGFAATAAVGQSISWILTKHAFMEVSTAGLVLHPLTAAYQRMLGGVLLAVVVFAVYNATRKAGQSHPLKTGSGDKKIHPAIWVVLNALAGPVFGVSCMLWAIREVNNPGLVQAVVATATLFTVPMARHFEKKVFCWNYFLGAGIALIGVVGLVYWVRAGG